MAPQLRPAPVVAGRALSELRRVDPRRLDPLARAAGLIGRGASLIAVYHDDPMKTPEAQLRADAGIMISAMTKVPPSLTEVKLEPGRYAHLTHTGPYEGLPDAWRHLWTEW